MHQLSIQGVTETKRGHPVNKRLIIPIELDKYLRKALLDLNENIMLIFFTKS